MNNLLLVLLTIPLLFGSCEKEEDEVPVINNGKMFIVKNNAIIKLN